MFIYHLSIVLIVYFFCCLQETAHKAKVAAAHGPSKAAGERRVRELQAQLHESEAALAAAQEHVHQLTQGLDASNDLIQVPTHPYIPFGFKIRFNFKIPPGRFPYSAFSDLTITMMHE